MADLNAQQKQNGTRNWSVAQRNQTALMLEDMYRGIAGDLKSVKKELLNEMKYSSLQAGVLYQSIEKGNNDTYAVLKKQMSDLCAALKAQSDATAAQMKNTLEAMKADGADSDAAVAEKTLLEIRYLYTQVQTVYESLAAELAEMKENSTANREALLAKVDEAIAAIAQRAEVVANDTDYDKIAETLKERVLEALTYEETDYERIAETVAEKTEAQVALHGKEILDTIAAIPAAENVDYNRIVDEVSDKVFEKVAEYFGEKTDEKNEKAAEKAYERIVYGTAEKVVESLPPLERINYARIAESVTFTDETIAKIAEKVAGEIALPTPEAIDYDKLADAVVAKLPAPEAIDYDRLADAVLAKMPEPEAIDYDRLADTVLAKMPAPEAVDYETLADTVVAKLPEAEAVDYETLADTVVAKLPEAEAVDYDVLADTVVAKLPEAEVLDYERLADTVVAKLPEAEAVDYDVLADTVVAKLPETEELDYERLAYAATSKIELPEAEALDYEKLAADVATKIELPVPEQLDYDRLATCVAERMPTPEPPVYNVLVDEVGVQTIADTVAQKVAATEVKAPEIDVDVLAADLSEKMGAPAYETILDESGAQMIADAVAEKLQATPMLIAQPEPEAAEVQEEVAFATTENTEEKAEDDFVVRLDRSFTAKLKQSADEVKDRYSMIKNALLSYKKVKSTVSWNCDRFNCGRATVAKMNIRGKTLCIYFALDPKDEQFKQTIYNQRDVSEQKAYEKTPFMMKIKSDLGAKRAVRLVEILAEQNNIAKKKDFEEVDYKKAYRYAADRQLELTGLIKRTKGKKVVFDFD